MKNKEAVKTMAISGLSFAAGLLGLIAAVKNIRSKNSLTGALMAVMAMLNFALGIIHSVKYIGTALETADDGTECDFCCDACPDFEKCMRN